MHHEGHGEPFEASGVEGSIHGSGAGFHTDSDDHFVGHVLHRIGSADHASCVRREGS